MEPVTQWLLDGEEWVEYNTRLILLGQSISDPKVVAARARMVEHTAIRKLVHELGEWPGEILTTHKSAGHLLHKLVFAADIGLTSGDPGMQEVVDAILLHQDPVGPFQVRANIPVHFGGTGEDTWAWALCDAPLVLYALVQFGLADHPKVQKGVDYLVQLIRDNGWPCAVSKEMGKFRGPGRKMDPCPYATLVMLRLLASIPSLSDSQSARFGAQSLLSIWKNRLEEHPYIFYMGTDFCKLKAPLVWFDILHVTNVLTQFSWLKEAPELKEMLTILASKADIGGHFTPESIWASWKDWEFGQKKKPSPWLTFLVYAVLQRGNLV